ncbi:glycosyltransferase family 8 protein [Vibrio rotiferianus]|uniref:glycosyltransferase family 8 protein n=1 Tax=Vibrio rotiferianus TaxID=190895 RepID=UPI002491FAD3|nr:glycosyltransferase [Vibrio rotiferianus]
MHVIPIVHCFDNNYVTPASVAFFSLLDKADKNHYYKIYVLHDDISKGNQEKLSKLVSNFNNSEIIFIDCNGNSDFDKNWSNLKVKGHYSKAMFYKLNIASVLKEHDKVIISDVDVVYLNDISKDFIDYLDNDNKNYISGTFSVEKISSFNNIYKEEFTDEEISKLKIGAGYFFMNTHLVRQDGLEKQFVDYLQKNSHRLKQAEQDTLNICCYPNIGKIPLRNMVCNYIYDLYNINSITDETNYTRQQIFDAYMNPVQLHYASGVKPWNKLNSTKANLWLEVLLKTEFYNDFFDTIEKQLRPEGVKNLMKFSIPISKNRHLICNINKLKRI